jgi:hypothetical protein
VQSCHRQRLRPICGTGTGTGGTGGTGHSIADIHSDGVTDPSDARPYHGTNRSSHGQTNYAAHCAAH